MRIQFWWWTVEKCTFTLGLFILGSYGLTWKFQFQFVSCTSSVLKREAKRRLQCAAFNCAKVWLCVCASWRFCSFVVKSVFDKGESPGTPWVCEYVWVCVCVASEIRAWVRQIKWFVYVCFIMCVWVLCICAYAFVSAHMTQWGTPPAVAGSQAYSLQLQQVFPCRAKML